MPLRLVKSKGPPGLVGPAAKLIQAGVLQPPALCSDIGPPHLLGAWRLLQELTRKTTLPDKCAILKRKLTDPTSLQSAIGSATLSLDARGRLLEVDAAFTDVLDSESTSWLVYTTSGSWC
jgi:hypothetical protein